MALIKSMANMLFATACAVAVSACSTGRTAHLPERDSPLALSFAGSCGVCHAAPHPKRHYAEDWPRIVRLMELRMLERGLPALDEQRRRAVLSYLGSHAR